MQCITQGRQLNLIEVTQRMAALSNPDQAGFLRRYFKTGPGQYGEGDIFRGIRVPPLRQLAKACQRLPLPDVHRLLQSAFHEDRLLALLILVAKFAKAEEAEKDFIYDSYLAGTRFINNWDLVDCSAEHIVGAYLIDKDDEPLYQLAGSASMWERRISIMATFHFIKKGRFKTTFVLAAKLLKDREDLIHKAVGWMLREVGKRDAEAEEAFLEKHYKEMPRTMLRYAIERFGDEKRRHYLQRAV